jgi:hypothetical protein
MECMWDTQYELHWNRGQINTHKSGRQEERFGEFLRLTERRALLFLTFNRRRETTLTRLQATAIFH